MQVRPATEADVDAIGTIYAHHVRTGHATFELEPPPRERWLDKLTSDHPGDHFLLAEEGQDLLGYAYSGAYRDRAAYTNTRETTVYLAPDATGRGVGRALYDALLAELERAGVHTALAGVALPNDASEALHRACGFERLGVMRAVGRKFDRWIDVAWWQRMLGDDATRVGE
ncbi:GNAT family N-acetyltransferase [Nocardioides panacisoli]|uniref:GNAT family N-acetyltransferase n=1 Tax=Nocardioides panacisoli TaxID=627624 RepID=UPI001C62F7E6|nr:GNAT family N-acetyltransferase [Nocardioides panacisoli]QYJ02867.1 GNAT family N-acetyltransferase [Nocardioides panacisoli]